MMKMKNLIAALVLAGALFVAPVAALAQGLGQLGSGQLFANPTATPARGKPTGLSAYLDFAIGSTANGFPARISGSWTEALFGSSFAFSGSTLNLNPSGASTLGGVNSLSCPAHQWFSALSTLGVFTCTQPALADLPTGSQDTALGYWTSTVVSSTAIPNCTGALTYSTSTHTFGCNATTAGNVSNTGTPTANQIAQWTNATTIQGVNLASLLTAGNGIGVTGTTSPTISTNFAVKSDQTTATSTILSVNPGVQQFHPSAAKAWANFTTAATPVINASFNVSGVVKNSTGNYTISFTTSFANTGYVCQLNALSASAINGNTVSQAVGSTTVQTYNSSGTVTDPTDVLIDCHGNQ